MFEDSFVESQISHVSNTKRWTMLGSTALQLAIIAMLITMPLLHPERLTAHLAAPLVFTPPPPKPPVHVVVQQNMASASNLSPVIADAHLITTILRDPAPLSDLPPSLSPINMTGGSDNGLPTAILITGPGTGTNVAPARPAAPKRIAVSSGISAGMLLAPIRPLYPAIAKAAGISGAVIVEAVISKTGTVESLHVVSGPELLRNAALDAIRNARYRPYLLNGEPTEIQTTFTVNFKLAI